MAIIKAEVVMAVVETNSDPTVAGEVIIKAIIITNTTNITHMMMDHRLKQYGPPCALCDGFNHSPKHCFKGEHGISNLMEKMSLGSSNQHQNGLYQ